MSPLQKVILKNLFWRFGVQVPAVFLYVLLSKGAKR